MDVGSEEIFGDKLDAKKFQLNSKIKVGQKSKTFYYEKGNNVQSGTRQQNAQMFDHFKSTYCSEGTT